MIGSFDMRGWVPEATDDGVRLIGREGVMVVRAGIATAPSGATRRVTDGGEHVFVAETADGLVAILPGRCTILTIEAPRSCRRAFDALLRAITIGEDPVRARVPVHRPPAGWRGERRPYATRWTNGTATIEIRDAIPVGSPAALTAALLAGRLRREDAPGRPFVTATGLVGTSSVLGEVTAVELRDDRFTYLARLDGGAVEAFGAVVDSIEPVPRPVATQGFADEVFAWM